MRIGEAVTRGLLAASIVVLGTGCPGGPPSGDPPPTDTGLPVVTVTEDVTVVTTWTSDNLYEVSGTVSIQSVLTIQPGTVVKFDAGGGLDVLSGGTLVAKAMAGQEVVFTSIKDDEHGGDTNGDGGATSPARHDWSSISFASGSTGTFDHCQFSFGGGANGGAETLGVDSATTMAITSSLFAHNDGGTPSAGAGVLDARYAGAGTVIKNNTFYDNSLPLTINGTFSLDGSNVFHNPADAAERNAYNAVVCSSDPIEGAVSWAGTEVPYVVSGELSVDSGNSLSLGAGVVVKFAAGASLSVEGTLVAKGASGNGIVFTSIKDDTHGGDTNGDGDATSPAPHDWKYIEFFDTAAAVLDHCQFSYGGGAYGYVGTLDLDSSNQISVTSSVFSHNDGGALSAGVGVLDARYAGPDTIIEDNAFYDNKLPLSIDSTFSLDGSNVFHNPAKPSEKNVYNAIAFRGTPIEGAVSWSNTEVPYVVNSEGTLNVYAGDSLKLADNVVVKLGAGASVWLGNTGTLLQGAGSVLTSVKDDSHLGDSNGDGATTSPVKGDWFGVYDDQTDTWQNWSNVLYATQTSHNP